VSVTKGEEEEGRRRRRRKKEEATALHCWPVQGRLNETTP
jgi:hypothetical protein